MHICRHSYFFLLLLISMSTVSCAPSQIERDAAGKAATAGAMPSNASASIDDIVDHAVDHGFAGGVAVMQNGEFIYQRVAGSASLSGDIPVTDETLFHVASVAKYFTAVLVLRAVEEGRFSLDDSIALLAPETSLARRGVTFLDLLAHRSGLGSSYVAESQYEAGGAIAAIDEVEIATDKVGSFKYSNDGYDLLGALLERAYGVPYEELLQSKIIRPAALAHASHWGLVNIKDPTLVSQPLNGFPESLIPRNYGMLASGGLLISASDLARFESALMSGEILNVASLIELRKPRGETSIGQATAGGFLFEHPQLGPRFSALGVEDWGDNAALRHYLEDGIIVAVVTSRGKGRGDSDDYFRDQISTAIETLIVENREAFKF